MILHGGALEMLRTLPAESVQCCVTSPPYWGLRDYGVDGQIGLERTPEEYVARLVEVFGEVRRVLRDDGTLWLNLGDSYAAGGMGAGGGKQLTNRGTSAGGHMDKPRRAPLGLKPKDLVGIPWMVAFALRSDGWYLRSDIIWAKPNPMPESVTDRPTKSHEYIFLLSKSERYYFDADAVREPIARQWDASKPNGSTGRDGWGEGHVLGRADDPHCGMSRTMPNPLGRNIRTVWTIATQTYSEAHFATFPEALVERCIAAGSRSGDTVLDPFIGSGTVGEVAERMGRKWIGIELSPEYIRLAEKRTAQAGLGI
jgi:DNA modification methylase